jgi:hypothetical protein
MERDDERIAAAHRAVLHVNALDQRRKTRFWSPECAAALAQAEATIAQTPGRLLLEVMRRMREGGPQAHDPVGVPMTTTTERSQRPRHGEDGTYSDTAMRPRWR